MKIKTKTAKSKAKRYNAYTKPKPKRIAFEKKVLIQGVISIMLFVYCLIISGTETATVQKEYIHKAVNISDTKNDIKNLFVNIFEITKNGISGLGNGIGSIAYKFDSGFGTKSKNTVMASPAVYPPIPEHLKLQAEQTEDKIMSENAEPTEITEPQFRMPLEGRITSSFGSRIHPLSNTGSNHYGTDIAGNHGDCVISSLPGTVEETGFDKGLGNYVKVRHSEEMITVYGHLSEIMVRKGEAVDGNTRIGSVGATGAATGPHLHFEVRVNGKCVDPAEYLPEV